MNSFPSNKGLFINLDKNKQNNENITLLGQKIEEMFYACIFLSFVSDIIYLFIYLFLKINENSVIFKKKHQTCIINALYRKQKIDTFVWLWVQSARN